MKRTIYPGLKSHPHHELARKQMNGFGGLISFDVGSLDNAKTVLNRLRLMALAESLGGVETLISHPAIMTHASVPPDRRADAGHHRRADSHFGRHRGRRGSQADLAAGARGWARAGPDQISSSS